MSYTVEEWKIKAFAQNVLIRAQQRASRLLMAVTVQPVKGQKVSFDRLSSVEAVQITTRHQATVLTESTHDRRWASISTYAATDLIDIPDRLEMIHDPTGSYTLIQAAAMGRKMDSSIITAFDAAAEEGKDGGSTSAFPSGQEVAVVSGGLTLAQLLNAKELIEAAEVDDDDPRYFVCSARQINRDLLNTTEVKSADYNTVKALATGQMNAFLGFTFIRSALLGTSGGDRKCFAFTKSGMGFAKPAEFVTTINKRADVNNADQVHTIGSFGSVRVEDVKVVRVLADEP